MFFRNFMQYRILGKRGIEPPPTKIGTHHRKRLHAFDCVKAQSEHTGHSPIQHTLCTTFCPSLTAQRSRAPCV